MAARSRPSLALLAAGFSVWAVGFVLIYTALSFGCANGWDMINAGSVSLQRGVLVGLSLLTVLATALVAARLARGLRGQPVSEGPASFTRTIAFHSALAATGAVIVTFAGVAVLSTC